MSAALRGSLTRPGVRVFLWVALAASLAGCFRSSYQREPTDRGKPKADEQAPDALSYEARRESLWERTVAYSDDPANPLAERLKMVEMFSFLYPTGHAHVEAMEQRSTALGRALEEQRERRAEARQTSEIARYRADKALDHAAKAGLGAAVMRLPLRELASWALFEQGTTTDPARPFTPITLTHPDGRTTRHTRPLYFGVASVHDAVFGRIIRRHVPSLIPGREVPWALRRAKPVNALLAHHLSPPLFDEKNPGKINREALEVLLEGLDIGLEPGAALGASLEQLCALCRPSIRVYAQVYLALRDRVGRAKTLRAYRAARRAFGRFDGEGYNTKMMDFYYAFPAEHALDARAGLTRDKMLVVAAGFWMRRMDDGTDRLLFDALERNIKSCDPALARTLARGDFGR